MCWIRGFYIGDARLGGVKIFDARVKIQHDAHTHIHKHTHTRVHTHTHREENKTKFSTLIDLPLVYKIDFCALHITLHLAEFSRGGGAQTKRTVQLTEHGRT